MEENIRDTAVTVTTASKQLALEVPSGKRTSLIITNTSGGGQVISLAWGKAAVALSGVVLYAGGTWSETVDNQFTPSGKEIWAISSAAGGTLSIQERILQPRGV